MPLFVCFKCFFFLHHVNKRSICGITASVLLNEGQFKHFLLNFRFYYVQFQSSIDYIKYICCPYKINQRRRTPPPLLLFRLRHQRFRIFPTLESEMFILLSYFFHYLTLFLQFFHAVKSSRQALFS